MKIPFTAFLILTAGICFAGAQVRKVGEGDPVPKDGFADFAELKVWATESSFGGGGAMALKLDGKDVFFSNRTFTSGLATSELLFYSAGLDGRLRVFLTVPTQHKEHRLAIENNHIVVRCYNATSKDWPIAMTITAAMLPHK
jgi:hypothetical protein